ncbi:MAG TPA: DUF4304 domain-containing protein [Gemmatimonadaceae bacterium]|nr:DUF4304 domain-containing protein [Gemmatimonadaceae bacterium]
MRRALQQHVVPALRQRGFSGTLPHFRRIAPDKIDLLTFQFDRYGGGFVLELAEAPAGDLVKSWGKVIPAKRLCALDVNPPARRRLQPGAGLTADAWFRFDDGSAVDGVVQAVLHHLSQADAWFAGDKTQPNIR